ncbi:MAG: hypothetical protein ACRETB_03705 [Steroidobacteraceae bacterium]
MKGRYRSRLAGTLGALALLLTVSLPAAAGPRCDEACLDGFANRYLAALIAHDPAMLPTTRNVRFTENTVAIALGQGLWTTISKLKSYRHLIADPDSEQVGLYTAIEENGTGALLAARLKLEGMKVSELETIVVRKGDMGSFLNTDGLRVRPGFLEVVPERERASRRTLIHVANLYFEGLVRRTGDIVPFSDACRRFENGIQTAGAGTPARAPFKLANGRTWSMPTGCKASFNTRMFSYISRIDHRRFEIVDRSRGVVMSFVMFQHEGNVKEVDVPGVGEVPMFPSALHPFAVVIAETFEIKHGKIREIEADMTKLPYGAGTGWPP